MSQHINKTQKISQIPEMLLEIVTIKAWHIMSAENLSRDLLEVKLSTLNTPTNSVQLKSEVDGSANL